MIQYYYSGLCNYYNRQIKMPTSTDINDFKSYYVGHDIVDNFNPNDGMNATIKVNYWDRSPNLSEDTAIDYMIVSKEGNDIDSRWFVLDRERLSGGQWRLTLRRDVISDNYENVIEAPCFIEKATLPDTDPFIFNSEDMTFNQIKESETLLKDKSGCAWVVGYLSRKAPYTKKTFTTTEYPIDYEVENLADYAYYDYSDHGDAQWFSGNFEEVRFHVYATANYIDDDTMAQFSIGDLSETPYSTISKDSITSANTHFIEADTNGNFTSYTLHIQPNTNAAIYYLNNIYNTKYKQDIIADLPNYLNDITFANGGEVLLGENGKIIHDTAREKYYKIQVKMAKDERVVRIKDGSIKNNLVRLVSDAINTYNTEVRDPWWAMGSSNSNSFAVYLYGSYYQLTFTEISNLEEFEYTIIGGEDVEGGIVGRPPLLDAPYDMFCMPYSDDLVVWTGHNNIACSKAIHLAAAMAIKKDLADHVLDIQILPYCPFPVSFIEEVKDDGSIRKKMDLSNRKLNTIVKIEDGTRYTYGAIIYCNYSQFSIDIPCKIEVKEPKIEGQTDTYRLCSPNYSGVFEFNAAKNGGVSYFNVDCNYKPINPYIHVNPDFGGLYGKDFNDSRGLICNGDFSIPYINDAWQQYEVNNKNYQQIFDRQIQNMELTNSYQKFADIVGAFTGTATGGLSGAGAGMMAGGPVGATLGGIGGSVAGFAGGITDIVINEALRAEAIDFTKDNFGYQLGNIKAMPQSLGKTAAITANNKLFPFVEKYTATDTEKQALRDKIKYNGMTVMRIGKIADYLQSEPSYIKGRIIRIPDNTKVEFHEAREIANEIYKGVFI